MPRRKKHPVIVPQIRKPGIHESWKPIYGNKARRYIDPTGETHSRREYLKLKRKYDLLLPAEITNEKYVQYRQVHGYRNHLTRYNSIARDYAKTHGMTMAQAKRNPHFKQIYQSIRTAPRDYSEGSELRMALEDIGRVIEHEEGYATITTFLAA